MVDAITNTPSGSGSVMATDVSSLDQRMRQQAASSSDCEADSATKPRRKKRQKGGTATPQAPLHLQSAVLALRVAPLPSGARARCLPPAGKGASRKPVSADEAATVKKARNPVAATAGDTERRVASPVVDPAATTLSALKQAPLSLKTEKKRQQLTSVVASHGPLSTPAASSLPQDSRVPLPRQQWIPPQAPLNDSGVDSQGIRYQFKSWGAEHSVLLQRTAGSDASASAFVLHPSSSRVEQQLLAHPLTTADAWLMRDARDQQQQPQDQNDPTDEEEG
jgi:hypothetical protein